MNKEKQLEELLKAAEQIKMSKEDQERQRRSFAFGNTNMANPLITQDMIDQAANLINQKQNT